MEWSQVLQMKQRMIEAAKAPDDWAAIEEMKCPDIEIPDNLRWIWRTFMQLSESRSWLGGGMGAPVPSPISFFDVIQWSNYHGYDEQMTYILFGCIKEMDRIYIAHMIEQQNRNQTPRKNAK